MSRRPLRPVPAARPRAVLYLRQSTYREESVSLELQETAGRDHAARNGYEVVAVEADPGISGRTFKRAAVTRVMGMVEAGQADVIVLWRWSRLSRARLDWAVAVHKVETLGGKIESATEHVDVSTASGRLSRGMLAELAAFESERIGEGWKEVHARRISRGLPANGRPRYGYRVEGRRDGQRFVLDPEQSAVLLWCYQAYLDGQGGVAIAKALNRRGIQNQRGTAWSNSTVMNMLDSGFGAGLIVEGDGDRRVYHPGAHPPIITAGQWRAFLAARARRATVPSWVSEPKYPLTGLIRCGDCGASMHTTPSSARTAGYQYVCARWRTTKTGRFVSIVRHIAETEVLSWLADLASDVDAAAAADRTVRRAHTRARTDARVAAREVAELERQLGELTRQLLAGVVPEVAYAATRDELMGQHTAATARLALAEDTAGTRPAPSRRIARALLDEWDELPVRACRDLLATLVDRVEVHPPAAGERRASVVIVPVWAA